MKVTIAHKKRAYPVHSKSTWRGCTIWRVMGRLRDRLATVVQIYCIHMSPTYVACICTCVHIHCVYPVRAHPYSVCVCVRACACITTRSKYLLYVHYVYAHVRVHVWGCALVHVCLRHVTVHSKCTYLYTLSTT